MRRLKSELKKLPYVDHSAWRLGEFLHYDLPKYFRERHQINQQARPIAAVECFPGLSSNTTSVARSPFRPSSPCDVSNPVLTRTAVTDYGSADFVADPFLFIEDGEYHLFFEIFNDSKVPDAVIGHATSPDAGRSWEYDQVVLKTDHHLSFPFVFSWNGEHYMIPEMECDVDDQRVILYKADPFPTEWSPVSDLIRPSHATDDTVVFRWNDRWWLLIGDAHDGDRLYAYFTESEDIENADWTPHRRNPVVDGRTSAFRPGGRPIIDDEEILFFFQDCEQWYGEQLRAYRITTLTPNEYEDEEHPSSPILTPSDSRFGWNSGCMHHIDPWFVNGKWICAVDGNIGLGRNVLTARHWSIGVFTQ
ncbi:glucosamine inositolphosphorylceramide transferase family protein [Haladaptatus caseinilyticus]